MDKTYALKLIERALYNAPPDSGIEGVSLAHTDGPYLKVLINEGRNWYDLRLVCHSAEDVTAEDDREVVVDTEAARAREAEFDHRHSDPFEVE